MADIPTVTGWDETSPAGNDNASSGDDRIREMKTQVREIVDVDHKFDSSGQDADMGKHNKCSFIETDNLGTGAEGKPIFGAQTVDGVAELVVTTEDDDDLQLTTKGAIRLSSGVVDNNDYLTATDNAGTGTVDIIKVDTSDVVVVADGVQTATNAAPTDDKGVSNKKYVDDRGEGIKAWVNFDGTGTISINDSFNVASITDNGTGDYTITWTDAFSSANYVVSGLTGVNTAAFVRVFSIAAGSVRIQTVEDGGATTDQNVVMLMAIGS